MDLCRGLWGHTAATIEPPINKIDLIRNWQPETTVMSYVEFRTTIQRHLERHVGGATWNELRDALKLPYERPCPEWTRRLEREIGLVRQKAGGRALRWTLAMPSADS